MVCDPLLIRFALQNLLSNAIKYTARIPAAVIEVGGEYTESETVCWVRDNGIGFKCQGEELFHLFKREMNESDYEGLGIGLAIVKKIVARHGGRVFAESICGGCTTIGFAVPQKSIAQDIHQRSNYDQ